jgi:hypothetical protein
MQGEKPASVELLEKGIEGDRNWAVRDEKRGGLSGAKRFPDLMRFSSTLVEDLSSDGSREAEIVFPDGQRRSSSDPALAKHISEALGQEVTFWPLLPEEEVDHYRLGAPVHSDIETELRAIFGRTDEESLPDLSIFPPETFQFASPPGSYYDVYPLHVMTSASLSTLQERAPESVMDVRRFRPSILIGEAESGDPFPEAAWCGKRLGLGEAEIEIVSECPRCVMTTHGFGDLAKDPSVMRALVRENNGNLGVYAKPIKTGRIQVGDPVVLLAG